MVVGLPPLVGPFALGAIGCAAAAILIVVLLRHAPRALLAHDDGVLASGRGLFEMWRVPRAKVALITLAVAQTVMVMIMAMTPLHIRTHGHGLSSVGVVISAHVFGMYGLSPVSGRLVDRIGATRVILCGFATLVLATVIAAAAPQTAGIWLTAPLFLLGFGWSLSFVAGSALLSHGLSYSDRARLQGGTDFVVWTAAAMAGLGSGVLVGSLGYATLCLVGALLIAVPLATVWSRRTALAMT